MAENPHYKELLQLLNESRVEYLIVGGFAVMKYGEPRYTKNLDVWVHNSRQNSVRVVEALKRFGAPSPLFLPSLPPRDCRGMSCWCSKSRNPESTLNRPGTKDFEHVLAARA